MLYRLIHEAYKIEEILDDFQKGIVFPIPLKAGAKRSEHFLHRKVWILMRQRS